MRWNPSGVVVILILEELHYLLLLMWEDLFVNLLVYPVSEVDSLIGSSSEVADQVGDGHIPVGVPDRDKE